MREFKFRVWDLVRKSWLKEDEYLISSEGVVLDVFQEGIHVEILDMNEDALIEQNTGLKDKNGVEIYEGDIVKVTRYITSSVSVENNYEVRFENGAYLIDMSDELWTAKTLIRNISSSFIKVVGNIHDNTELLGETK